MMKVLVIIVVVVVLLGSRQRRGSSGSTSRVLFRFGRVQEPRAPRFRPIISFADMLRLVSLRIVTTPIQSQGVITRDNVQ
jgi:regulator of protease activity HflC (stomatin/prohibitin superfamily)